MRIGILALQGAVSEHAICLKKLNLNVTLVKEPKDLTNLNGLIMPGGESTTLRKLLKNSNIWEKLKQSNIPIMGTCAGAILIGKSEETNLGKIDMRTNRNYYGRQKDSFEKSINLENKNKFKGIFIRAPAITIIGPNVEPIAWDEEKIVGCREQKHMALTFHPELTDDLTFHKMWVDELL